MAKQFVFDCPECDSVVAVGGEIRAEILEHGCVLCEAPASVGDFCRPSETDA
ncbi:hypothetical protein [Halogeometricum sp. CBA1124]|uniref:DUF7560 family zinc ribbon protein n=1 Tax=Halogeometricum sp. CBA1124 TaxID=2668071 RepID=UPI00174D6B17|nr:hypothetical protein [Halogeometricum sp. CBA1124]